MWMRSRAKDDPLLAGGDALDLRDREEQEPTPEQAGPNLEQVGLIDAREEPQALDDADPARRRSNLEALTTAKPVLSLKRPGGVTRIDGRPSNTVIVRRRLRMR